MKTLRIVPLRASRFCFGFSAILMVMPQTGFALEPLKDFLVAGRKHAVGNRLATLNTQLNDAKADESFWRLFPSVSASVGYLFNANPAVVTTTISGVPQQVTLSPHHQFDANFVINVPVFDLPAIYRYRAAKAGLSQSKIDAQVAEQQSDMQITRAYYSYVAGMSSNSIMDRHLGKLGELIGLAKKRVALGTAQQFEINRAALELKNIRLAKLENQANLDAASRSLQILSGSAPSGAEDLASSEDLPFEMPLAQWQSAASAAPLVRSAESGVAIAEENVAAAKSAYVPKVNLTANDRLTNNSGFQQSPNIFTVGVTATINFDLSMPATVRSQKAASSIARLKVKDALDNARSMIAAAYDQMALSRSRFESSQDGVAVFRQAAEEAYKRYVTGTGSQEEILRSQQDLVNAEITEARALAEFFYSQALLYIVAGKDLTRSLR